MAARPLLQSACKQRWQSSKAGSNAHYRSLLVTGFPRSTLPVDVRRHLNKVHAAGQISSILPMPTPRLQPTGGFIITFDNWQQTDRFLHSAREIHKDENFTGRTLSFHPVDTSISPYFDAVAKSGVREILFDRLPLPADEKHLTRPFRTSFAGKTVALSGFPGSVKPGQIYALLRHHQFSPIARHRPMGGVSKDYVLVNKANPEMPVFFARFLEESEAHRAVREFHNSEQRIINTVDNALRIRAWIVH